MFYFKRSLPAKIYLSTHIAFSSETVVLSESGEKYTQSKHRLQVKTVHMLVDFDVRGLFLQGGGVFMNYGL